MKKYFAGALAVVVIVLFALLLRAVPTAQPDGEVALQSGVDPANTQYFIDGKVVTLVGGYTEPAEGAVDKTKTRIFADPVVGDLDGDTDADMALVLVQEGAGSGTFYYVVVALQNPDKTALGTNAIFIGDRIAPQSLRIDKGEVEFTYATRLADEPMTAQPSLGQSLRLAVVDGQLLKVE